ncbi:hypothetical protein ACQJBY_032666 [Aegilops geniculata]
MPGSSSSSDPAIRRRPRSLLPDPAMSSRSRRSVLPLICPRRRGSVSCRAEELEPLARTVDPSPCCVGQRLPMAQLLPRPCAAQSTPAQPLHQRAVAQWWGTPTGRSLRQAVGVSHRGERPSDALGRPSYVGSLGTAPLRFCEPSRRFHEPGFFSLIGFSFFFSLLRFLFFSLFFVSVFFFFFVFYFLFLANSSKR